jgi:hypothetical protein
MFRKVRASSAGVGPTGKISGFAETAQTIALSFQALASLISQTIIEVGHMGARIAA